MIICISGIYAVKSFSKGREAINVAGEGQVEVKPDTISMNIRWTTTGSETLSDQTREKEKTKLEPTSSSDKNPDFSKKANKDVMSDAISLFNAGKTSEAAEQFEYFVKKGHKPAASNFYLGEIAYKQKAYSTAIQYYQKSIQSNDKADYTAKLLYHTAISFDKIGDTQSANRFYKALKAGYPDSSEAKAAPNRN